MHMLRQIASLFLVGTLLFTFCGTNALAQTLPTPDAKPGERTNAQASGPGVKNEARTGASLRAEVSKLIASAKAERGVNVTERQIQPKQSNSLSKGAKIAIVAGVALVVILI